MKRHPAFLLFFALIAAGPTAAQAELRPASGKVPFWLGVADNRQIDARVAGLLSEEAAVVVLRANLRQSAPYDFPALVTRLHSVAPDLPVLVYSWASRHRAKGRSGDQIMGWLADAPALQMSQRAGKPMKSYGDVTNAAFRERAAKAIREAVERVGADGVAIDLAVRTPAHRPRPLARRCETEPAFCERYAQGMDALFAELRQALGKRPVLYNGLWTFGPGMAEDQARLLQHADAAIVEYFGMNPRERNHSFQADILPYLRAMKALPEDKRLFVYGRGSWQYTDFGSDYQWQRYLYAAYLLASRPNTYFKYHTSFQVPAHAGRSGGLDTYADWKLPLGSAMGEYRLQHGVYSRRFSGGLVLVSPDDGKGGSFELDKPMYSPEGEKRSGKLHLSSGTGLILLERALPPRPRVRAVGLEDLRDWKAAQWVEEEGGAGYLSLDSLDDADIGEHDVLLDNQRTLDPAPVLHLRLRPRDESASVLIVAEVNDPERRINKTVLVSGVTEQVPGGQAWKLQALPRFRAPARQKYKVPHAGAATLRAGEWQELQFDPLTASPGKYEIVGWRYVRLVGAMDVSAIETRDSTHVKAAQR